MSDGVVVAAAIVRAGRVLAARRSAPADLAGRWEFPGGKLEPGESEAGALARECREELGVQIAVGPLIAEGPIHPRLVLRLYAAAVVSGEPGPLQDHAELRWLATADLDALDWLPADRSLLASVRPLLVAAG
ncbi:MAG: (deoxy)nucleoside triphosphate pyrophosphohydrolase [Jatrophihabitantaceae bacterium]